MNATCRFLAPAAADCDVLDTLIAGISIGIGAAYVWPQLHWLLALLAGA